MNKKIAPEIAFGIIILLVIVLGLLIVGEKKQFSKKSVNNVFVEEEKTLEDIYPDLVNGQECPNDMMKFCSDGYSVNKVPPSCEYEKCPDGSIPKDELCPVHTYDAEKICSDGYSLEKVPPSCEYEKCPDGSMPEDTKEVGKEKFICPEDKRKCSDGTFVTRIAPFCELKQCPGDDPKLKTYSNQRYGFEFKYPSERNLSCNYSDYIDFANIKSLKYIYSPYRNEVCDTRYYGSCSEASGEDCQLKEYKTEEECVKDRIYSSLIDIKNAKEGDLLLYNNAGVDIVVKKTSYKNINDWLSAQRKERRVPTGEILHDSISIFDITGDIVDGEIVEEKDFMVQGYKGRTMKIYSPMAGPLNDWFLIIRKGYLYALRNNHDYTLDTQNESLNNKEREFFDGVIKTFNFIN